jgi:hypothetical protein
MVGVSLAAWYKDLYRSGLTYGLRAGVFPDVYKAARLHLRRLLQKSWLPKKKKESLKSTRVQAMLQLRMPLASAQASGEEG